MKGKNHKKRSKFSKKVKWLFNYCVYRIAFTSRKNVGYIPSNVPQARSIMRMALFAYALTMIHLTLSVFHVKLPSPLSLAFFLLGPLLLGLFDNFFIGESIYESYHRTYKDEENRWLKGFAVFMFLFIGFASYLVTILSLNTTFFEGLHLEWK